MYKTSENSSRAVDGTTGTPLGGFGAGAVKFCAHNGTFAAVTQAPADQNDYVPMGRSGFQFYSCCGGQTETLHIMQAYCSNGRYEDDAVWPEHRVNFGTLGRIKVRMTAFSPLDPKNPGLMSMPYAFYELELENESDDDAAAACAFHVDRPAGPAEYKQGKGFASDKWAVYAASSDPEAVMTCGGDDSLFFSHGEYNVQPLPDELVNKTAVKVNLAPGETKTIRFVLAWYDDTDPERAYYLNLYDNPGDIAALGIENFDRLKANADELVNRMRGSNLPVWLQNQTLNTLANLSNNSMYKKDGRVAFAEGEWTCFGTMDQMWHARQIVNQLVPFFAWQELRYWARTQKDNGQIHHDFNSSGPDKSVLVDWDDKDHRDYREISKWVDLNCGFIISVFETFRATNDREQLDFFWPYIQKAGQRILDQVELYGSPDYAYTFDESENSYDAGGDPNPYNASLSAAAYRIMIVLAGIQGEKFAAEQYQTAYDTVVSSYRARYLKPSLPAGRGCESYFAGQWLALHLKLGEIWSASETDAVLESLDSYYHPYYWGLGNLNGTYNEWTPYLLVHYGGLLLNTGRAAEWAAMQKDAYNRQYNNRNYVFNHPLDILPAAAEPDYAAATVSGDKQYISMPGIWRNYYDIAGFCRDSHTKEIWLKPVILEEMAHEMTEVMVITPEGYGTVSCKESGEGFQNKEITVKFDQYIEVSTIHMADPYGDKVTVAVNGEKVAFTRSGTGYARELLIEWNGRIGSSGISIVTAGDPGSPPPPLPAKPSTGADGIKPSALRSAYRYMEAESADETAGVSLVTPVGGTWYVTDCHNFDYIKLDNVVFEDTGSRTFKARVSSTAADSRIEIVLDSVGGEVIGSCPVPCTGGEGAWVYAACPVTRTSGTHHVILKFYGNTEGNLLNIDKFKFVQDDGRLDRSEWTAAASRNGLNAYAVLDEDAAAGWRASYQADPIHLIIDMQEEQLFNKITLDSDIGDNPGPYRLFVSADGVNYGNAVAAGSGRKETGCTEIEFLLQKARFVKLVLSDGEEARLWTIYALNVWNTSTTAL
ncbi:hypothetical protein C2I18_23045 [Paenibacillus sp. PK3_47]|uniref:carbohydrate-binding protein n=1 Tax=Paenibacillus sp. PK3_47 TaxID=2072642 RepID=UPI00201DAFFD|nr:carbohydrate-binding protein [Paenibacillus sp. PK3_47]UQZ36148.1 hypothetical protein C2I18_23045 [Paenibacillus sp. PK3_47]